MNITYTLTSKTTLCMGLDYLVSPCTDSERTQHIPPTLFECYHMLLHV